MTLDRLVRLTWRAPRLAPGRDHRAEARLLSRISLATRVFGTSDRDCLQRSLLIYRELSRAGADPSLVIGFRRTDGRVQGHAWVVSDGVAIGEGEAELLQFAPAFSFGRRGARLPAPDVRAA